MAKLTDKQRSVLALIGRSEPNEDGWYIVSSTVWPLVEGVLPAELVETTRNDNGVRFLRLTERGRAVLQYAI